ncbi:MAG TPA: phosphoribosylanthranilate isomerase [Nitrososphaeraceae archaeon]|nr:phosphoribosylanthranilate isomerase [Nitrososphaeraceae archaeon]
MKVKICGITNLEDAMQAISFGADALGFQVGMQHKTEDELSPEEAKSIVASLPPFVSYVMVTHLQDAKTIISLLESIQKTTTVQLHDDDICLKEISAIRKKIPSVRIIKAIHVVVEDGSEAPLQKLHNYDGIADALILDSVNLKEDRIGGTGMTHDWTLSKKMVDNSHLPVILAGGLTPDNVQYAIRSVGPYAVDVNSGVKISRTSRRKDPVKVRNFIYRAKNVLFSSSNE